VEKGENSPNLATLDTTPGNALGQWPIALAQGNGMVHGDGLKQ
jgi:hypothetical protein